MTWLSLSTPGAMCSTMGHNVCHPDSSEQRKRGGRISHSFAPAKPLPVSSRLRTEQNVQTVKNGIEDIVGKFQLYASIWRRSMRPWVNRRFPRRAFQQFWIMSIAMTVYQPTFKSAPPLTGKVAPVM